MSFSGDVKNECARIAGLSNCCEIAETAAFLRASGKLLLGGKNTVGLSVVSGNAAIVRRYYAMIKTIADCPAEIIVVKGLRLNKHNRYELRLTPRPEVITLMKKTGMWQSSYISNDAFLLGCCKRSCCRKAVLRGLFLGAGSLSSPRGDYHLEINLPDYPLCEIAVKMLGMFSITGKTVERKDSWLLYLKGADAIIDFLRAIGAGNSVLHYENTRVVKEMRNRINRQVNCETANLQKTVATAGRQIEKIRRIIDAGSFDRLPAPLKITAETRLNHPEASIGELVEIIGDGVTKSGINHRLRKLESIADAF